MCGMVITVNGTAYIFEGCQENGSRTFSSQEKYYFVTFIFMMDGSWTYSGDHLQYVQVSNHYVIYLKLV